jgi:hypothetical protein
MESQDSKYGTGSPSQGTSGQQQVNHKSEQEYEPQKTGQLRLRNILML